MKTALFLLLMVASAMAIPMAMFEQKETGVEGTQHFNISGSYDCNKTLTIHIESEGHPVASAMVRLFYEERYSSVLGAGSTDASGDYAYTLIGNPDFMQNVFIATVEKTGFRTKEAHFVLPFAECAAPPAQNQTPPVQNQTQPVPPQQNQTAQNMSGNVSGQNQTLPPDQGRPNETEAPPESQMPFCPVSLILLIPFVRVFIEN